MNKTAKPTSGLPKWQTDENNVYLGETKIHGLSSKKFELHKSFGICKFVVSDENGLYIFHYDGMKLDLLSDTRLGQKIKVFQHKEDQNKCIVKIGSYYFLIKYNGIMVSATSFDEKELKNIKDLHQFEGLG